MFPPANLGPPAASLIWPGSVFSSKPLTFTLSSPLFPDLSCPFLLLSLPPPPQPSPLSRLRRPAASQLPWLKGWPCRLPRPRHEQRRVGESGYPALTTTLATAQISLRPYNHPSIRPKSLSVPPSPRPTGHASQRLWHTSIPQKSWPSF